MKAEDKYALITSRLAERLRTCSTDAFLGKSSYFDDLATIIMNGDPLSVAEELTRTYDSTQLHATRMAGLWETIAPMIDSLSVRDVIEVKLRGYEGMPLTTDTINEILGRVDRVLDAQSGTGPTRRPTSSRSHRSSTGVWGGTEEG